MVLGLVALVCRPQVTMAELTELARYAAVPTVQHGHPARKQSSQDSVGLWPAGHKSTTGTLPQFLNKLGAEQRELHGKTKLLSRTVVGSWLNYSKVPQLTWEWLCQDMKPDNRLDFIQAGKLRRLDSTHVLAGTVHVL